MARGHMGLHCSCGATLIGRAISRVLFDSLAAVWSEEHQGRGHSPCSAREAQMARVLPMDAGYAVYLAEELIAGNEASDG
ncbi:MAG: hypothetical protein V3V32_04325 [Dehalococcoidia bacterium]